MRDGRALQAGTSHYMGTNFARAFDIRYTSDAGQDELCHTTSWGMSTRMIGGVVMTHGDDKGLVFPPRLAPYQVVIVPITRGGSVAVEEAADDLARRLRAAGVRTHVDARTQVSPGFKYNEWEMRGVPIRLELGPRDLESGTAMMVNASATTESSRCPSRICRRPCRRFSTTSRHSCWPGPPNSVTATPARSTPGTTSPTPSPPAGRSRCIAALRPARTTSNPSQRRHRVASRSTERRGPVHVSAVARPPHMANE